jgi:hypothetical protein
MSVIAAEEELRARFTFDGGTFAQVEISPADESASSGTQTA